MGAIIEKTIRYLKKEKDSNIVITGLDCAGKTTICYYMFKQLQGVIPTLHSVFSYYEYKNLSVLEFDLQDERKCLLLNKQYVLNAQGMIFVLDCSDTQRFDDAKERFKDFMSTSLDKNLPLLIFANKQDLNIICDIEIEEKLELANLKNVSTWYIQKCVATTQVGLEQGLDWLRVQINSK